MGSGRLLVSGVVLGIVAGVLFSYPLGLNIVMFVLCVIIMGVILLASVSRRILTINSVFVAPTLFFAGMMMVEMNGVLNTVNTIVMIVSLMLLVFFHDDPRFMGGSWRSLFVTFYYVLSMEWLTSPLGIVREVGKPLLDRANYASDSSFQAVLRGFAISIPIVLVAGGLLRSADLVFQQQVHNIVNWIVMPTGTDFLLSVAIGGIFFWMSVALFRVLDTTVESPIDEVEPQRRRKGLFRVRLGKLELSIQAISAWLGNRIRRLFHLSVIESGIILGSVVLLFVGYVVVEFPYFFGGTSNIGLEAYTYSSYTRRGFFEAIAAAGVSMVLILGLNSMTFKTSERNRQVFQGIAGLLIMASLPIMGSALMRLMLYESAYGLTHARLVGLMGIVSLPLGLGLAWLHILWGREGVFQIGSVILPLVFLGILNVIRPDAVIAQRNIDRFWENGQLDSTYLLTLSDDAVPTLATFADELVLGTELRGKIVTNLSERLKKLDQDRINQGVFGYHYGKSQAWKALNQRREILQNDQAR